MRKISALLALLWAIVNCVHAQQDTTNYFGMSNYMFKHLNKNQITTGLMSDYGIEFLDFATYNGLTLDTTNYVGLQEWRLLYASLYSTQINGNANLEYLDAINTRILNYITLDQPNTLSVMHFNYQSLRPDAVSANLISVTNDQMYDVPGQTQNPYQLNQLFAVAPLRQAATVGANIMIIRSDMFFSNTGKTISSIGIDVGETGSFQTVVMNAPFSLNFPQAGSLSIGIRFTFTDSSAAQGHTRVIVYPVPPELSNNSQSRNGSTQRFGPWSGNIILKNSEPISATKNYLGQLGHGDYTVQLSTGNQTGKIRKPLIIVEGFDMNNSYGFRNFTNSLNIDPNTVPQSYINLNDQLDDYRNYDLIFLNFGNGTDYIQRNAFLLERLIEIVNSEKENFNGVRQQNVVLGLSMGGLVARYALRDMEINGQSHDSRVLITHDTPHHGANIPVGYQAVVQHLAPFKMLNAEFKNDFPWVRDIGWKDMFPDLITAKEAFDSPAAKQMIIQRYQLNLTSYHLSADNSMSQSFYNELNGMGWPTTTKNFTSSNGNCNGAQIFPANSRMFEIIGEKSIPYLDNLWVSALMSIAAPISPAVLYGGNVKPLGLLVQLPLSLISSKTSINIDFEVNSVPEGGTGELYRFDLFMKRKLAWIINSKTYILKTRINSVSGMLPLDNAPGGVYDMLEFGIDPTVITANLPKFFKGVEAVVRQPKFCFVPTVSSLALSSPWQNLKLNLCNNVNCLNPTTVQNYFAAANNEIHTSFSQLLSNKIFSWQDPDSFCPKICGSTLSISGPIAICDNATYTIPNLPSGVNVSWTLEGAGSISSASAGQVIVSKTSEGITKLKATVSTDCNAFLVESSPIQVGVPYEIRVTELYCEDGCGGISPDGTILLCGDPNQYSYYNNLFKWDIGLQPAFPVEVNYYVQNNNGIVYQNKFMTSQQTGTVYLPREFSQEFHNLEVWLTGTECNTAMWEEGFIAVSCNNYYKSMVIYPNPSIDEMRVTFEDLEMPKTEKKIDRSRLDFSVKLLDSKGKLRGDGKTSPSNREVLLKVADLPNGIYFLHISEGKNVTKKQVIIRH